MARETTTTTTTPPPERPAPAPPVGVEPPLTSDAEGRITGGPADAADEEEEEEGKA